MFKVKPLLLALLVAILAVSAVWINYLLSQGGAYRDLAYHGGESCTKLNGYVGAEDIVIDQARRVAYISSDDRRAAFNGDAVAGNVYALPLDDLQAAPKPLPIALDSFHPHGIDLWVGADGRRRLMVVNHAGENDERIEIFDLTQNALSLDHVRTVRDTRIHSPNDVAAVGPEQFYFTND
ncbi:MAG: hypothetical protein ACPG06_07875, partial [Alphaproteobacteria bacterium]